MNIKQVYFLNKIKKIVPKSFKKFVRSSLAKKRVTCVICGGRFESFLPFGLPPMPLRENAKCPNCGSLERTRIYWKYLLSLDGFFKENKTILHVAPERKLFKKFRSNKYFKYHPIDKYPETYPSGTEYQDITNLSYPDNYFDFILCSHVLEHVLDDRKALSEFYRVLKPGGFAILQVPLDLCREKTYEDSSIVTSEERQKAFGQHDHVRIYGKDYQKRLIEAGFELKLDDYAQNLSNQEKFFYGLGYGELLYTVSKK